MRRFWLLHAAFPGAAFLLLLASIAASHADTRIADAWFYDWQARAWVGAGTWWATDLIHTGGRDLVRLVALGALATVIASYASQHCRRYRSGAAYILLGIVLSTGIVGLLKQTTNVDCPWSLERYGGSRPYVALWSDRPDSLPHAACFPGAHSSSGFALAGFYFLLRRRSRRAACAALLAAVLLGVVFSLGQQARGAHFMSHDLTSAVIVWYVLLGLHATIWKERCS